MRKQSTHTKYYTKASQLIGSEILSDDGQSLGTVKDILVDLVENTSKEIQVVVAFGGFMGLGDRYFAVPFRLLANARGGDTVQVRIERLLTASVMGEARSLPYRNGITVEPFVEYQKLLQEQIDRH